MAEMTPLKTAEEAAPLVGLSPRTLKNYAAAGKVQCTRPGGGKLIFFSDEDIAAIRAESVCKPVKPALTVGGRSRRRAA